MLCEFGPARRHAVAFIRPQWAVGAANVLLWKGQRRLNMSTRSSPRRLAWIPFFVAGLALLLAGCGVNNIPSYEESARADWSQVLNQYQRRADLIPNLVATVQGYARQERDVLTAVVEARAKATQVKVDASQLTDPEKVKQFQDAQNQLSSTLGRLLAITENYPDLKSNTNFLALQSELEGTENRIAVARRDYIEAVRAYNTSLRTFPTVLWAKTVFSNSKSMAEFTATESAQAPPQVKF